MEKTTYHVTGTDCKGKRFKIVTSNRMQAMMINVYRGSVWEVKQGKRKLMHKVFN